MKVHKIEEILSHLENCIKYKKPFSHIRFGDGGIKFLHAILYKDIDQLNIIVKKEGLPLNQLVEIFDLWGYYARHADYIDTPEVYFTEQFWNRMRTPKKSITKKTAERLKMWKELYSCSEFDNENYCNPESNYLMVLRRGRKKNLIDMMKNRKVALITARPEVSRSLEGYDVDIIEIVGHYHNQYENSFKKVVDIIENTANNYDFWMVAAGELGRLYSGIIKESGGRTVDIGFVVEFWLGQSIHPRLSVFMKRNDSNYLELQLTDAGIIFEEYI